MGGGERGDKEEEGVEKEGEEEREEGEGGQRGEREMEAPCRGKRHTAAHTCTVSGRVVCGLGSNRCRAEVIATHTGDFLKATQDPIPPSPSKGTYWRRGDFDTGEFPE